MNLKSCPFYGGEVGMYHNSETWNYLFYCKKCGMETNTHCTVRDEAIEAWNRRANEPN